MDTGALLLRKRKGLAGLGLLMAGLAVVSSLLVAVSALVAPGVPEHLRGEMRFSSVSASSDNPSPGVDITITSTVAGSVIPQSVNLQYAAYFGTIEAGSVAMTRQEPRVYAATIHGFPDGTEVWYVIATTTPSGEPVISESHTVTVGTLARGGSSGLQITDVSHSPESPMPFDQITVEATVRSAQPIVEVDVAYMAFCPNRPPVGIDPPMYTIAPNRYTIVLEPDPQCGFMSGTLVVYRVLARDASGNTAVSEDGSFRIGGDTTNPRMQR